MTQEKNSVQENLQLIKNEIIAGKTTSSKSLKDTDEIIKIHKQYLTLKGIEDSTKGELYQLHQKSFNENLHKLAHHLNQPFINTTSVNKIMDVLSFENTVAEKLTQEDMQYYQQQLKNKYPYEKLTETLQANDFNVFHTIAVLNGYKNHFDYQTAKDLEKQEFEMEQRKIADKQERFNDMKRAYKEALKEHQNNI